MADIRRDFNRTAEDLARVGKDAAYVAIGLGVVGFQRAQVARREIMSQLSATRGDLEGPIGDARKEVGKAWQHFDRALGELIEKADATLDPLAERLPSEAKEAIKQARAARDKVRSKVSDQLVA